MFILLGKRHRAHMLLYIFSTWCEFDHTDMRISMMLATILPAPLTESSIDRETGPIRLFSEQSVR